MSELEQLLAKIEAATGPDRELDELLTAWAVGATLQADATFDHKPAYHRDGFWVSIEPITPLTASIDAALALVERILPGFRLELEQSLDGKWWDAYLMEVGTSGPAIGRTDQGYNFPALAILNALLKALIARTPIGEREG